MNNMVVMILGSIGFVSVVYILKYLIQRFCIWLVWDCKIKLGKLAPYIFGIGMGRMPHKVKEVEENKKEKK